MSLFWGYSTVGRVVDMVGNYFQMAQRKSSVLNL